MNYVFLELATRVKTGKWQKHFKSCFFLRNDFFWESILFQLWLDLTWKLNSATRMSEHMVCLFELLCTSHPCRIHSVNPWCFFLTTLIDNYWFCHQTAESYDSTSVWDSSTRSVRLFTNKRCWLNIHNVQSTTHLILNILHTEHILMIYIVRWQKMKSYNWIMMDAFDVKWKMLTFYNMLLILTWYIFC